jgi:hypothetical protein
MENPIVLGWFPSKNGFAIYEVIPKKGGESKLEDLEGGSGGPFSHLHGFLGQTRRRKPVPSLL